MALNNLGKFKKSNPEVAINVLILSKKSIYIARRSDFSSKRQQANLLMIVDGGNRHYTTIKPLSA